MAKRIYRFDIMTAEGGMLASRERKCFPASAPDYASSLLAREPLAAAVFAFARDGRATHAVYRG